MSWTKKKQVAKDHSMYNSKNQQHSNELTTGHSVGWAKPGSDKHSGS